LDRTDWAITNNLELSEGDEQMWRSVLVVILIIGAVLLARQITGATPIAYTAAQPNTSRQSISGDDEVQICRGKDSSTYEIDGKRYSLPFDVIAGQAVLEGDIVLGPAADVLKGGASSPTVPDYIHGAQKLWAQNIVPYVIDPSVAASDRALVEQAIMAWQSATHVRFRQLSGGGDWQRENYLKFSGQKDQCTSNSVGVKEASANNDEDNNINVVQIAGCGQSWGRIAHEIGHVLGLQHEHSRGNRDTYITVLWGNIDQPKQFCRVVWDQPALANTSYDYDSIMHYAPTRAVKPSSDCVKAKYDGKESCLAFLPDQDKLDQQRRTLGTNVRPGQRDHLSDGDIARVNALYPSSPARSAQPCVRPGDRSTPCSSNAPRTISERRPVPHRCCLDRREGNYCRSSCPSVRVTWSRDRQWCQKRWCHSWPRRRCDDWFEARWDPPFEDWADRW
jgi:hypothetical protein